MYLFILFLAVLGLGCYADFSLVAEGRGCSLVVVCRLLIAEASLIAEHGLQSSRASIVAASGLINWGSWTAERSSPASLCHVGSSWTKDQTHVLTTGRQALYH